MSDFLEKLIFFIEGVACIFLLSGQIFIFRFLKLRSDVITLARVKGVHIFAISVENLPVFMLVNRGELRNFVLNEDCRGLSEFDYHRDRYRFYTSAFFRCLVAFVCTQLIFVSVIICLLILIIIGKI